jgi:hypothetical protein
VSTDRELLDELAAVLDQVDPVPTYLAEAAEFLPPNDFVPLTWLADSALAPLPGTRGSGTSRTLRFTESTGGNPNGTTVDLRLDTVDGLGIRALGLIHPSRGGSVQISWPGGRTVSDIDHIGWFRADVIPNGPLRFVIRQPGQPDLSTGWFVQ